MENVSNTELIAIAKLLAGDNGQQPSSGSASPYVAERLNQLIQEAETARLLNRAASGISGLVNRFKESAADPLPQKLSNVPPTAKALQSAGLSFELIRQKDPTLTGKELVLAKVVNNLDDAKALGATDCQLFIAHVGSPSDVVTWTNTAYRDFLLPMTFTFETWFKYRSILSPDDLNAFHFNLGTALQTNQNNRKNALLFKGDWLSKSSYEQWIDSGQFTHEQWNTFFVVTQRSTHRQQPAPRIKVTTTKKGPTSISAADYDFDSDAMSDFG